MVRSAHLRTARRFTPLTGLLSCFLITRSGRLGADLLIKGDIPTGSEDDDGEIVKNVEDFIDEHKELLREPWTLDPVAFLISTHQGLSEFGETTIGMITIIGKTLLPGTGLNHYPRCLRLFARCRWKLSCVRSNK